MPRARWAATRAAPSAPSAVAGPGSARDFGRWIASRSGPSCAPAATSVSAPKRRTIGSDPARQSPQYQLPPSPQPAQRGGTRTSSTAATPLLTIFENEVVSGLRAARRDRPGPQLHDLRGPGSSDHRDPRPQVLGRADHAAVLIEEDRVDREPHQQHGDVVRPGDAQRLAVGEPAVKKESEASREEAVRGAAVGREDRAPRAVAEPRGARSYCRSSAPTGLAGRG